MSNFTKQQWRWNFILYNCGSDASWYCLSTFYGCFKACLRMFWRPRCNRFVEEIVMLCHYKKNFLGELERWYEVGCHNSVFFIKLHVPFFTINFSTLVGSRMWISILLAYFSLLCDWMIGFLSDSTQRWEIKMSFLWAGKCLKHT